MTEDKSGEARNRVFISYGHDENMRFAIRLKEDLIARGYEAWFDVDRIKTGGDWEHYIDDGLTWTALDPKGKVILIMTPYSVRRPDGYCLNEIARAIQRGIPIIPVMLVTADAPASIRGLSWLDMRDCLPPGEHADPYRQKLEILVRAIQGTASPGELMAPVQPAEAVARDERKPVAGGPVRVFISFDPDQETLAAQLKKDLLAHGHEVWFDADWVKTGMDREHFIDDGLNWASQDPRGRAILIMTPGSVRRPDGYCLNEIARAVMKNVRVLPIMLVWCEPPLSICRIQWLDMMDCLPLAQRMEKYEVKFSLLEAALEHERAEFEGHQSRLLNLLKPISFDSEIRYNLDRFVGRAWVFAEIDRWFADEGASRVFWIVGGPGVGKSAISSWLCAHRPEIVAFHFCRYDNVQKRDPRRAVMSIAYQLSTQLPDYEERLRHLKLDEVDKLDAKSLFDLLIVQPLSANYPVPGRKIAILIDAMDEATADGKNEMAGFIAASFERTPAWLRLIVTSRPHAEVMGPLQAYTPFTIDILDSRNDRDIVEYLTHELERLSLPAKPDTIKRIAEKSNGLFLYAEYIVAELQSGRLSVDRLDEFPQGLGGIYHKFFERQFPNIDEWEEKICPVLEVIAAAMEPISLKEVGKYFDWNAHDERRFKKALGSLFSFDRGVVPFHKSVIDWLSNEDKDDPYFISPAEGRKLLADYGWTEYRTGVDVMSAYVRAYLPAHLIQTKRWADAKTLLTDLSYYEIAYKQNVFDVLAWWSRIEEKGGIGIVAAYQPVLADPAKYEGRSVGVAHLLFGTGHYGEAGVLYRYLIDYFRAREDHWSLKDALEKMGLILTFTNKPDEALAMLKEEEQLCRKLDDSFGLQDCLACQAVPLQAKGDFEGINRIAVEMESYAGRVNKRSMSRILHMKGFMLFERGRLDETLDIFVEKERLCREIKDVECLIWTLNMKAATLYEMGDNRHALAVAREMEKLCRDHGHKYALWYALINLGDIHYDLGNTAEAIRQLTLARDLSVELGIRKNIGASLNHLSVIYYDKGDLAAAQATQQEEIAIHKEQNDMHSHYITLGNMALVYLDRGQPGEALRLLAEKERYSRDSGLKISVQASLGNEALALYDRGDLARALELHREEEAICRDMAKKRDIAISRYNQANVYNAMGDPARALELYADAGQEFRRLNYLAGIAGSLIGRASILLDQGHYDEAGAVLKEAEDVCRRIDLKKGLLACRCCQAIIRREKGDGAGALALLKEAEAIGRGTDYREGLAIALADQAIVLACDLRRSAEALDAAARAREIVGACDCKRWKENLMGPVSAAEQLAKIQAAPAVASDGGEAGQAPRVSLLKWTLKQPKLEKN